MVDNDKKEWQKKIPEFTTEFVYDDALEIGADIYGPKKFVEVYESYFYTLSSALLAIKAKLTEVISLELRKKQTDIQETIENILCNVISFVKNIRSIDFLTSTELLKLHGVDILEAMKINKESDENIKDLINKFDKNCSCRRKGNLF